MCFYQGNKYVSLQQIQKKNTKNCTLLWNYVVFSLKIYQFPSSYLRPGLATDIAGWQITRLWIEPKIIHLTLKDRFPANDMEQTSIFEYNIPTQVG